MLFSCFYRIFLVGRDFYLNWKQEIFITVEFIFKDQFIWV